MECNLGSDFNKASIIRANSAFTGRKVVITERQRFNKRGTVWTHNYEHVESTLYVTCPSPARMESDLMTSHNTNENSQGIERYGLSVENDYREIGWATR